MHKYLLPTVAILVGLGLYALAQQTTTPASTAIVCAYTLTPLTITSGQFGFVQCDSHGYLLTKTAP